MIVEAQYNWRGELISYRQDNTFIPCDIKNRDFARIQIAISQGVCKVVEPKLGIVYRAYDREQKFSGYITHFGFASVDDNNHLFKLVEEQIANGTCEISEPLKKPVKSELKLRKLVLCTFFDQPWPHLAGPFSGELAYSANKLLPERNYRFKIKNLSAAPHDKLQLLLADHKVNAGFSTSCFPIDFGVIEIEVPVNSLRSLFKGEQKTVPSWMAPTLKNSLDQHYAQSRRKPSEGPDILWLIEQIGLYASHFFVEFSNHVIDAFKREYGYHDRAMPCLLEGNMGSNRIVIGYSEDGSAHLHRMVSIPNQSFGLMGEWDKGSLVRYQESTKSPNFLYQNALSRVSEMVRLGFHLEALATLNGYLEVVIESAFVSCVGENPIHVEAVRKIGHRRRLDILASIAKSDNEHFLFNDDFRARVASAIAIYKNRNSYTHALQIPEVVGRLRLEGRRKIEILFQGFLDYFEQNQFLMRLQAISEGAVGTQKIIINEIFGDDENNDCHFPRSKDGWFT